MAGEGNRRRAERVPVNAELAALGDVTYVSDLSEHGVFVHTSDLMPLGAEIDLRFTVVLDDPVVFMVRGRVARHQRAPDGMGIEFTRLTPETVLRLGDVVSRARPQDLGTPLPPPTVETDELDSAQTVIRPRPPELLRARVETRPADESDDELESSKTLVALRPVDAEIADDDDPDAAVSRKEEDR
jgi:Tfp pilus assembly protein PilZ